MKRNKALIIDAQLFQSFAIHRGMGKYSLALLEELNKVSDSYDQKILLINNFGIDENDLLTIKKVTSNFVIKKLDLARSSPQNYHNYKDLEIKNKKILDDYIEKSFKGYEVDFLILSLFQDAECSAFPSVAKSKCLLVYDLIPLQFSEFYLRSQYTSEVYLSRFKVFYEADHFFAISDTVATDITVHLGIPADRITSIYGAQIKRKKVSAQPVSELVGKEYVLLPTGDDHRKNNRRAVSAFNEINRKMGGRYKLVITSLFTNRVQAELKAYCDDLIFTGNVTEAELSWLYQNTALVLFPSEYEGLGMPVIEAVEFDKPVVCSNINVFREISDTAFNYCDPYSIESIEDALMRSLSGGWKHDKKEYKKILEKYSWGKTANLMVESLEAMPQNMARVTVKPRLAIFAPNPSGYSAIGKVVQEQHYILSQYADIDYYLEDGSTEKARTSELRKNLLPYVANCYNPWRFDNKAKSKYDKVIYHIGNSEYHVVSLIKALVFPSTIILHDADIEGLYSVARSLDLIDTSRWEAEKHVAVLANPEKSNFLVTLINKQVEIFVHSNYSKEACNEILINKQATSVIQTNLPTPLPYDSPRKHKGAIAVSLPGIIAEIKGIGLMKALANTIIDDTKIIIKIFGFSLLDEETTNDLQKIENVRLISALSDTRFLHELGESDIIVNYRKYYHGETSLSTLEALRQGKAVIVNDVGWFSELPDDVVYKVHSEDEILQTIKTIASNQLHNSDQLIQKRREFIEQNNSIKKYVGDLLGKKP